MPALEVKGLDVYYGHSHALQGVDLTLDSGVFSVVGRNGMGKTTLCKAIMGLVRASGGSIRIRGEEAHRAEPGPDRAPRRRLRPAGPAAVALAQRQRASRTRRRNAARSLDHRAHLRDVPAACRTQGPWRQSALRRRAADARDLARASDQSAFADHGRADRRLGAGHRRPGRGDAGAPRRGRRHVGARDRAEHRRGDGDFRERRHHGQWPRQPYHRLARGLPPTATCNSACLASGSTATSSADRRNTPGKDGSRRCAAARPEQGAGADFHLQSHAADALVAAGADRAHRGRRTHRLDRRHAT